MGNLLPICTRAIAFFVGRGATATPVVDIAPPRLEELRSPTIAS
ncbi:hypothetical protein [Limnofasciculus baicalensis]|nr:hypothetical protein [Limnofasciculus baicalensis]